MSDTNLTNFHQFGGAIVPRAVTENVIGVHVIFIRRWRNHADFQRAIGWLEHFQKSCSRPVEVKEAADFLGFGFVFAQSQAAAGMLLRSASPKAQNLSLPNGYNFSSNALGFAKSSVKVGGCIKKFILERGFRRDS